MVDLRKPVAVEVVPDRPSYLREGVDPVKGQVMVGFTNEKEPIATPCDIANHRRGKPGNLDRNTMGRPVARHIVEGDPTVWMENRGHKTDRSLETMDTGSDPTEVMKTRNHPNGAVAAHS